MKPQRRLHISIAAVLLICGFSLTLTGLQIVTPLAKPSGQTTAFPKPGPRRLPPGYHTA